jgi:hypothetical protein
VADHEDDFSERGCCENIEAVALESCPSPESSMSVGVYSSWNAVVFVVAAISAAAVLMNELQFCFAI